MVDIVKLSVRHFTLDRTIHILEEHEQQQLFSAIGQRSPCSQQLATFLVNTGAHLQDGLNLRWADISADHVRFQATLSAVARTLPLTSSAKTALALCAGNIAGPFSSLDQQSFLSIWEGAKSDVGLADDSTLLPASLRDTCAVRLARGGIEPRLIKKWMGHRSNRETMPYVQLAGPCLEDIARVLEPRVLP